MGKRKKNTFSSGRPFSALRLLTDKPPARVSLLDNHMKQHNNQSNSQAESNGLPNAAARENAIKIIDLKI